MFVTALYLCNAIDHTLSFTPSPDLGLTKFPSMAISRQMLMMTLAK